MAIPLLAKVAISIASSKEGRNGLKTVIATIGIFIGVIVLVIGGVFTAFAGFIFGHDSTDVYELAKEAVKARYEIENDLDVSILKLIGFATSSEMTENQNEIEQYIEKYFIIEETVEVPAEESTETVVSGIGSEPDAAVPTEGQPEGTAPSGEQPEVTETSSVTRFKTLDEILEMLKEDPFYISDEYIAEIREMMLGGAVLGEGGYTGNGILQWPVPSMTMISSPFGYRIHPITGRYTMHNGLDVPASVGTPIVASEAGKVILAGWSDSYGFLVKIDHENGMQTWYAHNSKLQVTTGQKVIRGQQIALSGATGNVTGPHLHFEVHINGKTADPALYLELP